MRFSKVLTVSVMAAVFGAGAVMARGMEIDGPAEVPDASYTGRQYVDSRGCVFVRAGYGSAVSWVARVTRSRDHLCGYKPTLAADAPRLDVAKSAPVTTAVETPVQTAAPKAPAPVAPAPVSTSVAAKAMAQTAPRQSASLGQSAPAVRMAPSAAPAPRVMASVAPQMPQVVMPAPRQIAPQPRVQTAVTMTGGSGYVSPYVAGGYAGGSVGGSVFSGGSSYSTVAQGYAGAPVSVVASQTLQGYSACSNGGVGAQQYKLSDGRTVVSCSGKTADPLSAIYGAAPAQVAARAAEVPTALRGGYISGVTGAPIKRGLFGGAATARPAPQMQMQNTAPRYSSPLVGGSGYSIEGNGYAGNAGYGAPSFVAPSYGAPANAAAPAYAPSTQRAPSGYVSPYAVGPSAMAQPSKLPSGYKAAWTDGRLNPHRGARTYSGNVQMAQLWTEETPARLVTEAMKCGGFFNPCPRQN